MPQTDKKIAERNLMFSFIMQRILIFHVSDLKNRLMAWSLFGQPTTLARYC